VDGFLVSPAQQARAQALSNAMLYRAMASPVPVTLGILCARVSDTV
jgi:hypothetical protein